MTMLENKVIVVTGGAGLIGQAFIKAVSEQGAVAVIADIDAHRNKQVCKELLEQNAELQVDDVVLDITSQETLNNAIVYLDGKYGRIDALVNNAYPRNKDYGKDFFSVDYHSFTENLSMNLGGYFLTSQSFAQYFKHQGYGNIVNVASIYGVIAPKFEIYQGTPMTMPVEYAAIKAGVIHLTKYMAKYFKSLNIRVNAISPGGVENGQPAEFIEAYNKECLSKGMLQADDLTGTLLYLLSGASQFVNGQNMIVDDGFVLS